MVKLKNYVAIDLEISLKRYKLFRISTIKDGSLVVSPQIKPIMEGSIKGIMDDIHISQHISGKNHIKIRNLKTKNYQIPSITKIANRKCRWYFCINAKDKRSEDIFTLNLKKDKSSYVDYYFFSLSALPNGWFTIYVEISDIKNECKSPKNILFIQKVCFKGFYIYLYMCSGIERRIRAKEESCLKINPMSCTLGN